MTRIALIHALAHSVAPINEVMAREWPSAVRMNLLDDSLSADLATRGCGLDDAMFARFERLASYAESTGAQAILFTCSAFGPCIEAVAACRPHMPVLKPNEAMISDALELDGPVGLIASFEPTLRSMPAEFPVSVKLHLALAQGALAALDAGDGEAHDAAVLASALTLAGQGCRVIALAQFSMARARVVLQAALPDVVVLSTPDSAVRALKRRLGA